MEAIGSPSNNARGCERGYVVVEPEAVITTQLSKVIEQNAHELIGQDEFKQVIDRLAEASPSLVESVVPKLVPLHNLTAIMKLLEEQIPINDMRKILEVLAELSGRNMSIDDTAEALRPYLIPLLLQRMVPHKDAIPVITLDPEFENLLINVIDKISGVDYRRKIIAEYDPETIAVVDDQMAESKVPF